MKKRNKQLKKAYVLDTNVVLNDPNCIFRFGDHDVILPLMVLEELDKFKKGTEEKNRNTRAFHRNLEELIEKTRSENKNSANEADITLDKVDITQGIQISPLSTLYFRSWANSCFDRNKRFPEDSNDHKILDVLLREQERSAYQEVILITDDRNLWIKALMLGLSAEGFSSHSNDENLLKRGITEIIVPEDELALLHQQPQLLPESCPNLFAQLQQGIGNQALAIYCEDKEKISYFNCCDGRLTPLMQDWNVQGLKAKNIEQAFALESLLDPKIGVIALTGPAGTGKTLITLLSALEQLEKQVFDRVMIARPIVELSDKTMGFLPGAIEEKIDPYFAPIYDNLEFIRSAQKKEKKEEKSDSPIKAWAKEQGIEFFALNFLRGRSIPNQLLIVDEAQNMTPHEMKTLITRLGEGSKVVVVGDTEQIDCPYLHEKNNGLAYLIECWSERPEFFHLHLKKGERSSIASIAAEIM